PPPATHLGRGDGAGVRSACGQKRRAGKIHLLRRREGAAHGAEPELAKRVVAPAPDVAVSDRAGVQCARRNGADRARDRRARGHERRRLFERGAAKLPSIVCAPASRLSCDDGAGMAGAGGEAGSVAADAVDLERAVLARDVSGERGVVVIDERPGAGAQEQKWKHSGHGLNSATSDSDAPGRTTAASLSRKKRASPWRSSPSRTRPSRIVPWRTAPASGPDPVREVAPPCIACEATE